MAGSRRAGQVGGVVGFSLIEVLVVLAVLAIAVTSGMPSLSDLLRRRALDGTAAELAADLRFARSEALRLHEATRMSFYPRADGDCYVVHTGAENVCPCGSGSATVCVGDALALKTVRAVPPNGPSLRANVASMLFDPRNGTNAQAGTIVLVDARGRAVHQVVNVLGRVRSCSPQGAVPGYRAC